MSKDKYPRIFLHQTGAIVSMNSLICKYFATYMKKDYEQLTVHSVGCFLLRLLSGMT